MDNIKMPTFEEAWAEKELEDYQYGPDALENVKFGWKIRTELEKKYKTAKLFKTAEKLIETRKEVNRLRDVLTLLSKKLYELESSSWKQEFNEIITKALSFQNNKNI